MRPHIIPGERRRSPAPPALCDRGDDPFFPGVLTNHTKASERTESMTEAVPWT